MNLLQLRTTSVMFLHSLQKSPWSWGYFLKQQPRQLSETLQLNWSVVTKACAAILQWNNDDHNNYNHVREYNYNYLPDIVAVTVAYSSGIQCYCTVHNSICVAKLSADRISYMWPQRRLWRVLIYPPPLVVGPDAYKTRWNAAFTSWELIWRTKVHLPFIRWWRIQSPFWKKLYISIISIGMWLKFFWQCAIIAAACDYGNAEKLQSDIYETLHVWHQTLSSHVSISFWPRVIILGHSV